MKYAVSSMEMKICDRNTSERFGIEPMVLMERAALSVCDEIDKWRDSLELTRHLNVAVFAGVGNNGGDGVAIARLLKQRGYYVNLCVVGDPVKSSDLFLKQLDIASKYDISQGTFSNIRDNKTATGFDIIVDAMFGIGLSRPVTGTNLEAVSFINDLKKEQGKDLLVISVDIPSGISADNGQVLGDAVRADKTVTFNQVKLGQILYPGCEYMGELVVADVGITSESFMGKEPLAFFYDGNALELIPERKRDSNKGTNGKVLIIAGSRNISGACILAASAALKAGAGMVRVFTAIENAEVVKALLPEAILDTYEDFEPVRDKLKAAFDWSSQAVIGPGIGTEGKGVELVTAVLEDYDKPLVMDADALNIIAEDEELRKKAANYATGSKKLILTPHMGEFARLKKCSIGQCKVNLLSYPGELAGDLHATVICKDARSIVADSNEKKIYINISGNDGMATAGSGDVLSGITGALIGLSMSGFETAIAAAYIHGCAGDIAAADHGRYSMIASDIVGALSKVLE
ncbi:NAD(P)H-hydrate dehydratase [Butyrivibrio sp. CB08]|uniref:NAD(P)H-hydrate dehydratase n=1 Tax=Butyrivibrio sp. CB08 TaxID=2364879 RepID=UPI000EAA046B|nr:NAD(P)H-hydrate dehydratase [Butyrivibrio sp. CB08]RKM56007.1 NAD(P)H-hydrate dehydratase [Butyrivibrio sp. CB08]